MTNAKQIAKTWIKKMLPAPVRKAVITEPTGALQPGDGPATFVVAVGPGFKQHIPNAHMTARMGYCHAFEQLGIPYVIADVTNLQRTLDSVPRPVCFLMGYEYGYRWFTRSLVRTLRRVPHFVWVNPWFSASDRFFKMHNLDAATWDWSAAQRGKILDSDPSFVFTATAPRGMHYFEQWAQNGVPTISLPLACDTTLYHPGVPHRAEFDGVQMGFVGGYWESKGKQIDPYLRPFEDQLSIFGYSKWPYRGYRGQLEIDAEPSLYRQAAVCPTINEPTVALMHGQINERVFKILGCGGCTVVDAVPAYRDFFSSSELPLPESADEFAEMVRALLADPEQRRRWAARGYEAVLDRHTYIHRARQAMSLLGMQSLLNNSETVRLKKCA